MLYGDCVVQLCDAGRVDVVCEVRWGAFEAQVEELLLWQAANTHAHVSPAKSSQSASALYRLLYSFYVARSRFVHAARAMYSLFLRLELEPFAPSILQVQRDALLAASNVLELVPEAHRWFVSQAGLASDAGDCALTVVSASDVHKQLLLVRGKLALPEHNLALGSLRAPEVVSLLLTHLASPPRAALRSIELASAMALAFELDMKVVVRAVARAWVAGSIPESVLATTLHHMHSAASSLAAIETALELHNALISAAGYGTLANVISLLNKGVNVNCIENNFQTPLHYAAYNGQLDVVRLLLEKGAKLEPCDVIGYAPLHRAAHGNQPAMAYLLLEHGAKMDAKNRDGHTPLQVAAARGLNDPIAQLLRHYPRIQDEDQLFDALREKRIPDATRILQNNFFHVNLRDSSETPLLHLVVATQDLSLLQAFLAASSVLLQKPNLQIDAKDATGRTALAVAITCGTAEAAQTLYEAGASLDLVDTKGETAWHMAAAKGHMSILAMLLQETKDENGIDVTNHNGESPLFVAATSGHADVVQCLLRANASPHVISQDGSTLLHAAAISGNMIVVHQIVQCGVNVDASDAMGRTPLHIAAEKAYDSVVKYLLDVDVNVFAKDKTGKTPLMLATNPVVINTLLQAEKSTKQKVPQLSETLLDQLVDRVITSEGLRDLIRTSLCNSEAKLNKLIQQVRDRLDVGLEALKSSVDRPEGTQSANARVQAVYVNDASQERTLLADDSQYNAANEAGDSPLHLAVQTNDHKTLAALLRSSSINVDVRNAAGVTPVILAVQMGHRRLATMLQTAAHRDIPSVLATDIEMDQSSPIYGTVYKGTYNGRVVAIKTPADVSSAQAIIHEMETMQQCNSPYVQQLLAVSDVNSTIAWVVANALADLHHNGVFHQDLESYNVLLSSTNYIKVANLGSDLEPDATTGKSTPYWTAPEVLASTSNYSFAADIYSFGVILTELDTLQLPYHDAKGLGYWGIIDGVRLGNLRPTVSANCPHWLQHLADACLSFDPTQRPSALMIVESLQKLLHRSEEELSAPAVREPEIKLAAPSDAGSSMEVLSDESPRPPTSEGSSDAVVASAINAATPPMAPAMSTDTPTSSLSPSLILVSTRAVCQLCRASNSLLASHCEACAGPLATTASKLKALLKRLAVAKKNGFEIDDGLFCDCCDAHQPMEATICSVCEEELPTDHEQLSILILRIEQATKSPKA
ncbi:TKL protein kinase [Saprolegnia parasitica CBS 223.65]|uniref:TKL protein kinase n=1 Tax=Saprolegnia parasitica (strain CBS 223.65) TaxID=695850 RepID=A0A067C771_SAPPC|nr:TKL protein kinase [Saprolegnia parasitica CBS 223.65]KDO22637.1 TKL protein kinase [Saprolegnia parasitica CBS 223.65]|eukprot:XP_012206672.1 TKL protein kinase [Saprolegnia parasitica CBS 223.65]